MADIRLELVSSLQKVFLDQEPSESLENMMLSGFENETISFQAAYTAVNGIVRDYITCHIESPISDFIRVRRVCHVPVRFAGFPDSDDNYLRKTPGLYPDLLKDLKPHNLRVWLNQWDSVWIDIEPRGNVKPGDYQVAVVLCSEDGEELARRETTVRILGGNLPEQKLIHTKWFHYDSLAHYYHVPVFSEEHWRIIGNFMKAAVKRGINMIMMPVHTPPLDTRVGSERLTVQLVDVKLENGVYSFGFDKLRRWVELADSCGVKYFEIAHLFTQWGAKFTPKIMATVDGIEKRISGWDVPADSDGYRRFLNAYIPALLAEFRALGIDERCMFHISDEPGKEHLESYMKAKKLVQPLLEGYPVMDAISDIDFYKSGASNHPIPGLDHLEPFLEANVPDLWSYYCISQHKDVSNMFISMPSSRNRILGVQLYKYNICGFLQWGFNFYGSQYSDYQIDPYCDTGGDGFTPAGDCFQVYPGENGYPEESIRMMVTFHAFQDMRALQLLESLTSRDHVISLIDELSGRPVTLTDYPLNEEYLLQLREKVNEEIVRCMK